jgi:uncharacterized membrane protein YphA (DoxX/SURF4 family)
MWRYEVSFYRETRKHMRTALLSPKLYLLVRVVLGLVFVYAGAVKLIDPKAFAKVISQYDILPEFLLAPFAVGLPALELLAGVGLISNIRGSLAVTAALLVIFILVLGYGILNSLDIDCGCFSPEELDARNSLQQALYRDLLMIGAVFYLYAYKRLTDPTHKNKIHYKEEPI